MPDLNVGAGAPEPVLKVRDLMLHYFTSKGVVRAVDGISFDLLPGESLGLVGESGCGKTTAGVALLNMPTPPGRIVGGSILLDGTEIVEMGERDLRRQVRWSKISMVFQGAMNCLTPVYTIKKLMLETFREHIGADRVYLSQANRLMKRFIGTVGLPEQVLNRYPHELSGGMKQRVVIAMALFLSPKVVIMDEPTTALDVIVQAQILNLIKELKRQENLSFIFITHDLATEAEISDRIVVMYAGKIAEIGSNAGIFGEEGPLHPYTQKLLAATPRLHRKVSELAFIPGAPPDLIDPPKGCRFSPRCTCARAKCRSVEPSLTEENTGHFVACWKAIGDGEYERSSQ
jgi:peptide/nickel transport system ATP-binding protein